MRERKYKFWDKHNKVWVGPYTLEQLADHDQFSSDREWQPICSKWQCYEPIEYIGLKDAKCNEIYEGDILGLDNPEDCYRAIVEYIRDGFKTRPVGGMIYSTDWENWIVIGNIYENPKLLEVK